MCVLFKIQFNPIFTGSSKRFLEDTADNHFCKTNQYTTACKQLSDNHLVILTGNPGEGKTTMAANLALENSVNIDRCLKLEHPSDWVNVNCRHFTTVIIDDIFGKMSMDPTRVSEWMQYLPDIERCSKNKELKFIITSRTYILKEALEELHRLCLFKENSGYVVQLDSANLEVKEMEGILNAVFARRNMSHHIQNHNIDISDCVSNARGVVGKANCVFGFPQCSALFATKEHIHFGSNFFLRPQYLFRECIEQLYRSTKSKQFLKFVTLVAIWAENTQTIKKRDIRTPTKHIHRIAKRFHVTINYEFINIMEFTLKTYAKFLIEYDVRTDEFKFNHSVIGEMVGVVLGHDKPLDCLFLCQRDFLMDRIVLSDNGGGDFQVKINEGFYKDLSKTFVKMMRQQICARSKRTVMVDADVLKHKAFENQIFVKCFIEYVVKKELGNQLFDVCLQQCNEEMRLIDYALSNELVEFSKQAINNISLLLSNGTEVSGDVLLMAMRTLPDLMEKLIAFDGTVVNRRCGSKKESYPLIEGTKANLTSEVKCLLKHGADINLTDSNGHTPLHVAIRNRSVSLTKKLLKKGAKRTLPDNENLTPLHLAVQMDCRDIIEILLKYNDEVNVKGGKHKETPLHMAVCQQNPNVVEVLLKNGADLSITDIDNMTVLHRAVWMDNCEITKLLVHHKDILNSKGGENEETPLHMAVCMSNKDMVKLLLEKGVDLSIMDIEKMTVLHNAVLLNNLEIIETLLQCKKEVNIKGGNNDETPLHMAVCMEYTDVVKMLLEHKLDVSIKDKENMTALQRAALIENREVVEILSRYEYEINGSEGPKE